MSSIADTEIIVTKGQVVVSGVHVVSAADNIAAIEIDFDTKYPELVGTTLGGSIHTHTGNRADLYDIGLLFGAVPETLYLDTTAEQEETEVSFRFPLNELNTNYHWFLFSANVSRYTASVCLVCHKANDISTGD